MIRVIPIIFLCVVTKVSGQNTRAVSFGLNKKVASFSLVGQIASNSNTTRGILLVNKEYTFDDKGRLHTEVDLALHSKQIYEYNKKGNCTKIINYTNDTLNAITYLDRTKDKIWFRLERNKKIELTGYYIVDKHDRIIEMASTDNINNNVVYRETYKYDNDSLIESVTHSTQENSMTTNYQYVITEMDDFKNWTSYNIKSDNVMTKESNYRRTIRYK